MNNSIKLLLFSILICSAPAAQAMGRFKDFGLCFAQAAKSFSNKNTGYINKGLKCAVVASALTSTGMVGKKLHKEYTVMNSGAGDKFVLNYGVVFGPKQQEYLHKKIGHLYTLNEPLFFGAFYESLAIHNNNCNHIFLQADYVPFPNLISTTPRKGESQEECEARIKSAQETRDKKRAEYYEENGIADIVAGKDLTIKHELGHVLLQHCSKRDNAKKDLLLTSGGIVTALNASLMKDTIKQPITNVNLLKKCGLIGLIVPLAHWLQRALFCKVMRDQEREADAFSLTHADSLEELYAELAWFKKQNAQVMAYGTTWHDKIFGTHPATSERIQQIMQAIEKRKQQDKHHE